jgi:lysophospholipase L1-like esterase
MRNLLFFGDSNTWGFIPASDHERYPYDERICGVLQKALGNSYKVIEEALNGRMTAWNDPLNEHKNATQQLPFILDSQRPLDVVIIMLGVNDMKHYMGLTAADSAIGMGKLTEIVKTAGCTSERQCPEIILVAPPRYVDGQKPFGRIFDGAAEKTKDFARAYKEIADSHKVHFFDAAQVATPPIEEDGVHIDTEGCRAIAENLAEFIKMTL